MANTWLCRILHGITILMLTIGPCSGAATGSDVGKEQRWAAQIVDSLLDGEAFVGRQHLPYLAERIRRHMNEGQDA